MAFALRLAAVLLAAPALVAGCGGDGAPAGSFPAALAGTYHVDVAAGGSSDPDVMSVSEGAGGSAVLTFVAGISPVRCQVAGATELTLPLQRLSVSHSTGAADGQATGGGTIAGGTVDLTIHLAPLGSDGSQAVDYRVTGTKQ